MLKSFIILNVWRCILNPPKDKIIVINVHLSFKEIFNKLICLIPCVISVKENINVLIGRFKLKFISINVVIIKKNVTVPSISNKVLIAFKIDFDILVPKDTDSYEKLLSVLILGL